MSEFEGKNLYEILNLPLSAGLAEVEQAYAEALETYKDDALATYALFTDEERKSILKDIDEAFQTLSDEKKRKEYNQTLISTGQAEAAMFSSPPLDSAQKRQEDQPAPKLGEHADPIEQCSQDEKVRRLIDEIYEKSLVSGEDLKQLREARGINISEIFQRTRISKTTLERIEKNQYEDLPAEVFLKSFLKSYAEILQIDPKGIVDGYLKNKGKSHIMNLKPNE